MEVLVEVDRRGQEMTGDAAVVADGMEEEAPHTQDLELGDPVMSVLLALEKPYKVPLRIGYLLQPQAVAMRPGIPGMGMPALLVCRMTNRTA